MATSYTSNSGLRKPANNDRSWDTPINENADLLDSTSAIGNLCVRTKEIPSTTLNVKVAGGSYVKQDGSIATYAGTASLAITASSTRYVYIDPATNTAVTASAWPSTAHVRLASVGSDSTTITSVTDVRLAAATVPIPQPSGASQAAVTGLTDSTGGTADSTVADVTASHSQTILNNNFADLTAKINGLTTLTNALRQALVDREIIKGSA